MPGNEFIALVPRAAAVIDTVVAWLATYALHSTVLILVGLAATSLRAPWRLSTSTRDTIWKAVIVGGIVTASVQMAANASPLGGTWTLRRTQASASTEVRVVVANGGAHDSALFPEAVVPTVQASSGTTALFVPRLSIPESDLSPRFMFIGGLSITSLSIIGAALLWFVGVICMLARYDRARSRLDRMLADRVSADDGIAGRVLREALRRAGVRRQIRLTASDRLESPAVLAHDEICVPRRFLREVNILEQETIFAHEIAHVLRRDAVWLRIANLVVHVLFFQPLNRVARARLIEAAEFSADELAVRTTGTPLHLARALAAVASWLSPTTRITALPAMASARGSILVRRVTQLTQWQDSHSPRRHSTGSAVAVVVLVASSIVVPRIDLTNPLHQGGVRRMVFQQRIEKGDGTSATQVRVVDWTLSDDSTSAPSGPASRVIVRRASHDLSSERRLFFIPRRVTVAPTVPPATSD